MRIATTTTFCYKGISSVNNTPFPLVFRADMTDCRKWPSMFAKPQKGWSYSLHIRLFREAVRQPPPTPHPRPIEALCVWLPDYWGLHSELSNSFGDWIYWPTLKNLWRRRANLTDLGSSYWKAAEKIVAKNRQTGRQTDKTGEQRDRQRKIRAECFEQHTTT